jgi:NADH:ubiquinone oxidoreductase subunit C
MTDYKSLLQALPNAAPLTQQKDGFWMNAPKLDVLEMARQMKKWEARFSTMTGAMLPNDETSVTYHYCLDNSTYNIKVSTKGNHLPSIAVILPAADWIEREIQDLFKVTFDGHPNPERLLRPSQLEQGIFREPGGAAGKIER